MLDGIACEYNVEKQRCTVFNNDLNTIKTKVRCNHKKQKEMLLHLDKKRAVECKIKYDQLPDLLKEIECRKLYLKFSSNRCNDSFAAAVKLLDIDVLFLEFTKIRNFSSVVIALTSIKFHSLYIKSDHFTDETLESFIPLLKDNKNIKVFSVNTTQKTSEISLNKLLKTFQTMPNLSFVWICHSKLTLEMMAMIAQITHLKVLSLNGSHFQDPVNIYINLLPELCMLIIGVDNENADIVCQTLYRLKHQSKLQILQIQCDDDNLQVANINQIGRIVIDIVQQNSTIKNIWVNTYFPAIYILDGLNSSLLENHTIHEIMFTNRGEITDSLTITRSLTTMGQLLQQNKLYQDDDMTIETLTNKKIEIHDNNGELQIESDATMFGTLEIPTQRRFSFF